MYHTLLILLYCLLGNVNIDQRWFSECGKDMIDKSLKTILVVDYSVSTEGFEALGIRMFIEDYHKIYY